MTSMNRRRFLARTGAALAVAAASSVTHAADQKKVVVVWSEGTAPKNVFPDDINGAVVDGLKKDLPGWEVVKAGIEDPDQGLPDDLLNRCDVLVWWGHKRHGQVKNELADKIVKRVKEDGMGFIALHSAHFAKPNIKLMEQMPTDPALLKKVRPANRVAAWGAYVCDSIDLTVTVTDPSHPIAAGVSEFTVKHDERYSDPYAVPEAKVIFEGSATLKKGGVDKSKQGFVWQIGKGKMFYFQPGHETNTVFYDANVRKIMINAVKWATPK